MNWRGLEGSKEAARERAHPRHADERILPGFLSPSTATVRSCFGIVSTGKRRIHYVLGPEHPNTVAFFEHDSSLLQKVQRG